MIGAGPGVCVDVQRLSNTGRVGPPQIDKAAVVVATSVGITLARGGGFGPTEPAEPRVLSTLELDQAALNLFTLAQQAACDLRIPGDFEVRPSVEPAESRFRHPADDRPGRFRPFSPDDLVPPFQPVEGEFLLSEDLDVALSSLIDIASDAVNQTGTQSHLAARDLNWLMTLTTSSDVVLTAGAPV